VADAEEEHPDAGELIDPTAVVGRRMAGWLIDTALVVAVFVLVLVVLGDSFERPGTDTDLEIRRFGSDTAVLFRSTVAVVHTWEWLVAGAAAAVTTLLLLVALPARRGWTPGLLAAELRLVDIEGASVGLRAAFVRFVGWIIDILPGVPLVGLAAMRFGQHHQRVGDRMAHTYVVDRAFTGMPPVEPTVDPTTTQVTTVAAASVSTEHPDTAGSPLDEQAIVQRRSARAATRDETAPPEPAVSAPTSAEDGGTGGAVWAPDAQEGAAPSSAARSGAAQSERRDSPGATAPAASTGDPDDHARPTTPARPATPTPGRVPDGVVADQPVWDRATRRYLMWHGATGKWVAFDDSDQSWKPI
jgi:uncharacterized RDD family membrane protein YckC